MLPLRVLITNLHLVSPTGTEMYIYDLAQWLMRMGHRPVIYSPKLGPLATQLIERSIPVVDRLDGIAEPPDIIHGHHSLETMTALLRFPQAPGIFVCHDCSAWHDRPPRLPRLRRYVAVDGACRDRLTLREGISPELVRVIPNGVDTARFRRRGPLPSRPARALLLSNYASQETLQIVQQACQQVGVQLDHAGRRLDQPWEHPEQRLPHYDLVFAKGRCAWEALAAGAAVIVCGEEGVGPLVTTARCEEFASLNFGRRLLAQPLTAEHLLRQLADYDAQDAEEVSLWVRTSANLNAVAAQLVELYQQVIEEHRTATSRPDESLFVADFLQWWSLQREQLVQAQCERLVLHENARKKQRSIFRRLARSVRAKLSWRRAA